MNPKQIVILFGVIVGISLLVYFVWDSVFRNTRLYDLWGILLVILLCLGITIPYYKRIENDDSPR